MYVWLECPHCHTKMRTRKLVGPGDQIRCPRCRQVFHLLPDEESLVETCPVVREGEMLMRERTPIPRTRAWEAEETPTPRQPEGGRAPVAPKREQAGRPKLFEHTRATVATSLAITLLGLIALFLYWYVNTVRSLDRSVVQASQQRISSINKLVSGKATAAKGAAAKGAAAKGAAAKATAAKTVAASATVAAPAATDRTVAPAGLESGSIVVGIPFAEIGPITVNNRETEADYLKLSVRVTNLSDKPVLFEGWHYSGKKVMLRDSSQNRLCGCLESVHYEFPQHHGLRALLDLTRYRKVDIVDRKRSNLLKLAHS